jgi:hypothetical protein
MRPLGGGRGATIGMTGVTVVTPKFKVSYIPMGGKGADGKHVSSASAALSDTTFENAKRWLGKIHSKFYFKLMLT